MLKQKLFIILFVACMILYADEKAKIPVWEMQIKDFCVDYALMSGDIILTGCKYGNLGKYGFIDKNGFDIEHITLIDRDLSDAVAQTRSHLILGNHIFNKFENLKNLKFVKELPYEFKYILAINYDFIATDNKNVVRYFDRNLNIKYEIYQTSEIKSIVKKDETLMVLVENEGLYKYDLKGNFIDKKEINAEFIDFLAFDKAFFTLEREQFYKDFQSVVKIKLNKYDYNGSKIFEKIVGDDDKAKIVKFGDNLLFITNDENAINLVEFNQNGDEIDKNIAYGYEKESRINSGVMLPNGDILLGGNIGYKRDAIFIKISSKTPLGKQEICKFNKGL